MSKSERTFDRWHTLGSHTWCRQVFNAHDAELENLWGAFKAAQSLTYSSLGQRGAKWTDSLSKHFPSLDPKEIGGKRYSTLQSWSAMFNAFDNWMRMNVVLTVASNLETYLASVVGLALESDPGVLLGVSQSIDGAYVLKYGRPPFVDVTGPIDMCTSGDWSARMMAFRKLFGDVPQSVMDQLSSLEELRKLRNRIGHAFGRDISSARRHGVLKVLPMERVSERRVLRLQTCVRSVVKSLDSLLLTRHIGEYEAIKFYQQLYPRLHKHVHRGQRAKDFKKAIGSFGALKGKQLCRQLVDYWESL